jgi:hypothetical protein
LAGVGTTALDFCADSGTVLRSRLILAISSGANVIFPFFRTARIFLKSTIVRISDSGIPSSTAASWSVFIGSGILEPPYRQKIHTPEFYSSAGDATIMRRAASDSHLMLKGITMTAAPL